MVRTNHWGQGTFAPSGCEKVRNQKWCEIGERIAKIRGRKSAAEFAESIGIHKNTLGRYERGETSVNGDFIQALVDLGYNANWILTGEGPQTLKQLKTERFDETALQQAVQVLETRLKLGNRVMTPEAKAHAVAGIYQLLLDEEATGKTRADLILELLSANI